jgi:hypothetical protein
MSLSSYLMKFKGYNSFYRSLIHSHKRVAGMSNREFFKEYFVRVSYRTDWITDNEIRITIYLQLREPSFSSISTNLKIRMKNIVFSTIQLSVVENDNILPLVFPKLFKNRTIRTKHKEYENT